MLRKSNAWLALALLFACNLVCARPGEERAAEEQKPPPAEPPPKAIIVSPEKWQEMLDKIARLEAMLDALQKKSVLTPSSCVLKGRLEGNLVVLRATFGFATENNGATEFLACSPAFAGVGAVLDGHEPNLSVENGGFSVKVEKPGTHELTLDLTLSVANRPDGRGFEMDLPRAATTEIDLELGKVKDVRRDGKLLTDSRLKFIDGKLTGGLGAVEKLDLSWKDIGATTNIQPVLTAQGKIQVQIDDRETLIRADLTLKSEGGPVNVWRLLVPVGAIVQVAKEDEDRVQTPIERADKQFVSLRTLRLKEASAEPLNVSVTVKKPPPRPGVLVPVGPFAVEGAQRQSGVIGVSGALSNLRPVFLKRGSTEEMRPADDARPAGSGSLPSFRYASVSVADKPQAASGPTSLSLLDLDAESVHGLIESHVTHVLRLMRDDSRRFWRVKTTIEARPIRPGADHIDLLLPPYCIYDERVGPVSGIQVRPVETEVVTAAPPLALGAGVVPLLRLLEPAALPRVIRLKFAEQLNPFKLTVEADYVQPDGEAGEASLPLPQPLGSPDRGGQVTITVPEDMELLTPSQTNAALKLDQRDRQQQLWRSERFPEQVRVHWQAHRPSVRATSVVDLTFTAREVQVRHRLRFHFPGTPPAQVVLVVPEAVAKQFRVLNDSEPPITDSAHPLQRIVPLHQPASKDEPATLDLEYSFPLPPVGQRGDRFLVPLVVPDAIARGETKVRIWGDLATTPSLPPDLAGWSEEKIEVVPENPRLPALVLLAHAADTPLSLRLEEAQPQANAAGDGSPITVLIDRALIRVSVGDGGQSYRASFLVTQLAARDLDVEFPAPVIGLSPRVLLDGKEVSMEIVDENGHRADGGRIGRLRLSPDLLRRPAVLEIMYHLPAGRANSGPLQTTLLPPLFHGDAGQVQTRWLIALPSNLVVLGPEGGAGCEPTWNWQGWLLAPRAPVTNLDLEQWFAAGIEASRADDTEVFVPSLVATRHAVEPLTVVHAPQSLWLLVCSLVLLACGLVLFLLVRPTSSSGVSATTWVTATIAGLSVLIVAVVVGRLFQPTLTSALYYGCEPGLAVLLLALTLGLLWWLLGWVQYRRQIVFLPSFTRGRAGSSIVRVVGTGSGPRPQPPPSQPHGEPSTVDLVPSAGSGTRPLADVLRTEESSSKKRGT